MARVARRAISLIPSWALACAVTIAILGSASRAFAQEPAIVGYYAIDHDVVYTGEQAVVTISLVLKNVSDRPAPGAVISVTSVDTSIDEAPDFPTDAVLGTFVPTDLSAHSRVLVRSRLVVPVDEWFRWRNAGPPIWLTYVDDNSQRVGLKLALTQTNAITDGVAGF